MTYSFHYRTSASSMIRPLLPLAALLMLTACATPEPKDYSLYREHMPASILVLPPTNQSPEVNAPYSYLSTVSEPIAEAGYYVFPVAVVDAYMKENGLPTPADMHAVPLDKLGEVFGADAVLYVDIEAYGQEFNILSSDAVVRASVSLVDIDSGAVLWEGKVRAVDSANANSGNALVDLIGAAVAQAVGTTTDRAHVVAIEANRRMVSGREGLLLGPYHPGAAGDVRGRSEPEAPAAETPEPVAVPEAAETTSTRDAG